MKANVTRYRKPEKKQRIKLGRRASAPGDASDRLRDTWEPHRSVRGLRYDRPIVAREAREEA